MQLKSEGDRWMSDYWICHQCGQRVPAGHIEVHNIQHLTRGKTRANGGASPADIAAFLTLIFLLLNWVTKLLVKLARGVFRFSRRKPRLAAEMFLVGALILALAIPRISTSTASKSSVIKHQKQIHSSTRKQVVTKKQSGITPSKSEPSSANLPTPSTPATPMPLEPIASKPTPVEHFDWPPSETSEVPTVSHTIITGANWTKVPSNPDWYTYIEPQWQFCGGGSQCQIIWWVSSKPCIGASPRAEYRLDGNTQSNGGWHGSTDPYIAVSGLYELPGNNGGDRSLQSRLAIYSPVSITCHN
jgi:hypothetical protein